MKTPPLPCADFFPLEDALEWQNESAESREQRLKETLEVVRVLADRVATIHGENHPELLRVQSLVSGVDVGGIAANLPELRRVTAGYALPPDACLSFRALYERLIDIEEECR